MRHIDLHSLLKQIFSGEPGRTLKERLQKAHKKLAGMPGAQRKAHARRNGSNKWKPVKDQARAILGQKCWYTEAELLGAPLVIDHFRPVGDYWWLTYDPENYRVACPWANSAEPNALHNQVGGKGDKFPLLAPAVRAKGKNKLWIEKPVILDPCNAADCELLAFDALGRPVLNPAYAGDAVATQRVEASKILLNLDHGDFNTKREQLCNAIANDVQRHEDLMPHSNQRGVIRAELAARIAPNAPFSAAARFYLRYHRHLDWVEEILLQV